MDRNEQQDGSRKYKSPTHAVIWNLDRSRETLRKKCRRLKDDKKRLSVNVRDVTNSREMWRAKAEVEAKHATELEAEVSALKREVADLKKGAASRRQ
jgi:SMC interacting uncharacterized protein involved in chromosome segregation